MSDEERLARRSAPTTSVLDMVHAGALTMHRAEVAAYVGDTGAREAMHALGRAWWVIGQACACRGTDQTHGHGVRLHGEKPLARKDGRPAWVVPPLEDMLAGMTAWPTARDVAAVAMSRAALAVHADRFIHTCHADCGCDAPARALDVASAWLRDHDQARAAQLDNIIRESRFGYRWIPRLTFMATTHECPRCGEHGHAPSACRGARVGFEAGPLGTVRRPRTEAEPPFALRLGMDAYMTSRAIRGVGLAHDPLLAEAEIRDVVHRSVVAWAFQDELP